MTNAFLASPLWGELFTDPQIEAQFGAEAFLGRMMAFEIAWTKALGGDPAIFEDFKVDWKALSKASISDGLPLPQLVKQLKAAYPDHLDVIHKGATSQDVIDTAMVLTLRDVLDVMEARIGAILALLDDLSVRFGGNDLMGRTRMQAALPIGAAARIGDWREGLAARLAGLARVKSDISVVQVGGPVGINNANAAAVAEQLGLRAGPCWHTDRGAMVAVGGWLTQTAGSLGKIGQDVALMAQQGIGDIQMSGGGGSSAMPHKQNPVLAETLVALARYVAGQNGILGQAMVHEQERSGAGWALEWLTLPAMAEATGAALNHATMMLSRIERIGQA